jgi:SNF2 family DNA or RNA helicase
MTSITSYHAKYFAYELTKRSSSNSLQKLASSLLDAQVDLNPHQVEAALFAFNSPLSKGAILADEVGLGKTIEAGIVISQKWAERKKKILIIVPSNLRKQWNQELLDKFFLSSIILETPSFNQEIKKGNLNSFEQEQIVICSYHFARTKEPYITRINWDLVVIDEAHRLRNVYKPTNKISNAIKRAVSHAPKILLTATPLQNSLLELYGLVSIIDDYTFGDLQSYKHQFSRLTGEDSFEDLKNRLKPVCKRTLRRQVLEYIKFTNRLAITQEFIPSPEEQKLYDLVSSYLQRNNLYALPASQRQLMTLILRRLLASSTFAIAGTLEALASKLETLKNFQENKEEIESVISQDFETYDEVSEEWKDEWIDEEETDGEAESPLFEKQEKQYTTEDIENINKEISNLNVFKNLAKSITRNSKGEVLLTALKKGFAETGRLGGRKKAIIFTESCRTQAYLHNILEHTEFKGRIVLFNGTNGDPLSREIYRKWLIKNQNTDRISGSQTADKRAAIVDYFRDEAVIMIATEAAAEGINLQFCSIVVNYDLPWNPQRIEQRIGRCHRYGQRHDVVVVNFLNKNNAADQRVYELLAEKFKLFSGVFGVSDEVLGSIESGVDFEKRIVQIYQNCRTPEEIQVAFDALQKELEDQIEDRLKNTRQQLLETFDEEVHEKLRVNLQESRDYISKYENWLWQVTRYYLEPYACFDNDGHSFTLIQNPFPNEKIHPGPYRIGKNIEDANIYRIGHPLAQRIIEQCKIKSLPPGELLFNYTDAGVKISILEPLIKKSGWLSVSNLTIHSFETEDYVLLSGISDDGLELDAEQCRRFFSLPASVSETVPSNGITMVKEILQKTTNGMQAEILQENAGRNSEFFDIEMGKLEKWADDVKGSLEIELKALDKEIKFRKTEARKILNLEDKVKAQRHIKDMEKKRNALRMNLFQSQDEVDVRKEKLIEEIEARLKQRIEKNELFLIRWKLV